MTVTPWAPREGAAIVRLASGTILLMGGRDASTYYNDVWQSTDGGYNWTEVTAAAEWSARCFFSCVVLPNGHLIIIGGRDGPPSESAEIWVSTNNGATWSLVNSAPSWSVHGGSTFGRYSMACVSDTSGNIILTGGSDEYSIFCHDVWISPNEGVTWTQQTAAAEWAARYAHTAHMLSDGSIVIIGGKRDGDPGTFNDVWRSTTNGATWTQQTAAAEWLSRFGHASILDPSGNLLVMGGVGEDIGEGAPIFNDVWISSPSSKGATWTQQTAAAEWAARCKFCAISDTSGNLLVMGGSSNNWRPPS